MYIIYMGKKSLRKYSRISKKNKHYRKIRKTKKSRKTYKKHRKLRMYGGFGPGGGPVGSPLDGGNISTWPGVSGQDQGIGNHYALSKVGIPSGPFDPPMSSREFSSPYSSSMKFSGGGKRKRRYKGGFGLIPQDLVNLGRSIGHNFSSFAAKITGDINQPVSPLPTKDQGIDTDYKIINTGISTKIPNLSDISKDAYNQVLAL